MKLYIKQRVFSLTDSYDIYDSNQQPVYRVVSKFFSIGAKMVLSDAAHNELFTIEQKLLHLLPQYEIKKGSNILAVVKREFSLFKPRITIQSDHGVFDVLGGVLSMDFTITKNGKEVGAIHKKWISWGDTYELDFDDSEDAALLTSLVLTIDHMIHNSRNR